MAKPKAAEREYRGMVEVEAVKDESQIPVVSHELGKYGRDFSDIWNLGINVALRISDLLAIKYDDIDYERNQLTLVEGKTKKKRTITLNSKSLRIISERREAFPDDVYLFQSHGNNGASKGAKPLHRGSVANVFTKVGKGMGLKLGTHSMRKTRGYILHKDGVSLEQIAKVLNHSSPSTTMRYIGLTEETTQATYEREI